MHADSSMSSFYSRCQSRSAHSALANCQGTIVKFRTLTCVLLIHWKDRTLRSSCSIFFFSSFPLSFFLFHDSCDFIFVRITGFRWNFHFEGFKCLSPREWVSEKFGTKLDKTSDSVGKLKIRETYIYTFICGTLSSLYHCSGTRLIHNVSY